MAAVPGADRGKAFVAVLSCVLSRLVAANDAQPGASAVITKFHALRPPSISIRDYLERINKYASCSPECFVLALVYIDRLIARNSLALNSLNVHRVVITAVMLAAKFFDDAYYNNAYYAKVGGVPCTEVNALELELLFSVGFTLHVPTDVYERYYAELASHVVGANTNSIDPSHPPTCDCWRYANALTFAPEELAYTGMRSPAELTAEALAAAVAQQQQSTTTSTVHAAGGSSNHHMNGDIPMSSTVSANGENYQQDNYGRVIQYEPHTMGDDETMVSTHSSSLSRMDGSNRGYDSHPMSHHRQSSTTTASMEDGTGRRSNQSRDGYTASSAER